MSNRYFFCPASGYLNKYNEKGSIGPISYQFVRALSQVENKSLISALVFKSYHVSSFDNVKIFSLIEGQDITEFSSLKFYLKSFLKFINRSEYKQANIVHHFMPFTKDITFNLFFMFKDPRKKYILGPLIGTHTNTHLFNEENFKPREDNLISKVKDLLVKIAPIIFKSLSLLTIRNADVVLFSDKYALNCYKSLLGNHQIIKILDIGIDTDVFDREIIHILKRPRKFNVLFVGRLTERKGCRYLIQAIAEVLKYDPTMNILCTIVGYGIQENELKNLVNELGIQKHFLFVGELSRNSEIVKYYNQADVLCVPALSDTWVSAKEALCCGKPVIITNVGCHPEIVQNGVNGYLVPIMNSKSIADKIINMASNPRLTKTLSNNAYESARSKYDWRKIVNSYLSILEKL